MRVYQLAKELLEPSFADAEVLRAHPITVEIAAQLYTAVGSIAANIREGYYRSSGKDRARIFEYALGSAGESEEWYGAGRPVLGSERTECQVNTLREIQRMLKAIIPRERNRLIRPHRHPSKCTSVSSSQCAQGSPMRTQSALRNSRPSSP
jgi:four helix bundle protein